MLSFHSIQPEPVRLRIKPDVSTTPSRQSVGSRRNPQSTAAILDAATTLLRRTGPVGLTIDSVARLARCGKPTVYRWWPDKLALLLDLHDLELEKSPPPTDLPRFWDRQLVGAILRAAFAEALPQPDALSRFRQRVLPRYGPDARAVLGDWLMGDASQDPAVDAPKTPEARISLRHVDEWVD
jgi:AcrR family transcriptional regulator